MKRAFALVALAAVVSSAWVLAQPTGDSVVEGPPDGARTALIMPASAD